MQALLTGFKFGRFTLDIIHKKLMADGEEIELGERNFQLLKLLCDASPEPVNKSLIMTQLWPDTVVSDWSISRLVSDTRQLLNDDGESQSLIKTARGIGFLIPNVEHLYQNHTVDINHESPKKPPLTKFLPAIIGILAVSTTAVLYNNQTERNLVDAMTRISQYQDNTFTAFIAQAKRRNELVTMIEDRLGIKKSEQYEKFFSQYFTQLNQQELFVCEQMRGITDTGLKNNNQAIVDELAKYPEIIDELPQAKALEQHLIFWLNKYDAVFKKRDDMCLLYVGVEDGVPYPSGIDKKVKDWLKKRSAN